MFVALSERQQIDYVKDFLWRKYSVAGVIAPDQLTELKAYAEEMHASATDEVTLTSASYEGAAQSGQIKFNPMLIALACNELIKAVDPDWSPAPAPPAEREISITARLGY